MVCERKQVILTVKGDDGFPGETLHLLVAQNVLDTGELKFLVSNAPPKTSVEVLLMVAFSRGVWNVALRTKRVRSAWISTKAAVTWD